MIPKPTPQRVSFAVALAMRDAYIQGEAENAYRFHTKARDHEPAREIVVDGTVYREVGPSLPDEVWDGNEKSVEFGPTAQMKQGLSDRWEDSWNDALAAAYSLTELLAFDSTISVRAGTQADEIAKLVIQNQKARIKKHMAELVGEANTS